MIIIDDLAVNQNEAYAPKSIHLSLADRFSTDFNIGHNYVRAAGQENSTKLKLKRFDRCVILFNERLNIDRTKGD